MALNQGKHLIEEIDGVRCTLVEKGIPEERADFLKQLLELNGYDVKIKQNDSDETLMLGVTDLVFNPVIAVYGRYLKSAAGRKVTPAYWLQQSDKETEAEINYWTFKS